MQRRADLAAIALLVLSMVRIASNWTLYSATVDEPMHVSCALELYTQHTYSYLPDNPPLPRLVFGLAPWLGGMEFDPKRKPEEQLAKVFYSKDRYVANLLLARPGNLVFFIIAALATWWWARRELGPAGGLMAMALLTLQPVVAGHSALATHEIASVAGMAVSLLAFARWLDAPATKRALVFGAAYGFAVLTKFSCVGYVPAACLAMYLVRLLRDAQTRAAWRRLVPSFLGALAVCLLTIWAGYGFTIGRLDFLQQLGDVLGHGALANLVAHHPSWPLPAHWFFLGIGHVVMFDRMQLFGYLFGQISMTGWWYYFPVAVALKSTLASLILALCALVTWRVRVAGEALAAALAILGVSMTSHLDLGVRYVLPLYVPLAVAGAGAAFAMLGLRQHAAAFESGGMPPHSKVLRVAAMVLLAWHCVASLIAIPDGLPYFNELAGKQPWFYLLDSNIDWGQDVLRLRRVVREKKIDRIGLNVMGWHDYDKLGFPPHYEARRDTPTQGWVAVSEHMYGILGFEWLRGRRYERVGKSIRLYYIP